MGGARTPEASCAKPTGEFIKIEDASFSYPDAAAQVLSGLSLNADIGAITCLMGVNGCGKSTLIDCILGDLKITAGSIFINGVDSIQLKPHQLARRFSYVPQVHERAFPYRTRDVVLMGRTVFQGVLGLPSKEDNEMVDEALAECGISHLAMRPYTQLSGGEVQMVLLARALTQQAPFILMDEPTAHLDFKNELFFMETVVHLVREHGTGVLIATHSPNQPFYFEGNDVPCTCALMDAGKIGCFGAPSEVLTPQNLNDLYGIRAQVSALPTDNGRTFKQILLIATEDNTYEEQ